MKKHFFIFEKKLSQQPIPTLDSRCDSIFYRQRTLKNAVLALKMKSDALKNKFIAIDEGSN